MDNCIFCNIANKKIPIKEFIYEDDLVVAFDDIKPMAPVHVLIIPKEHIESINELRAEHEILVGRMIMAAKKIAGEKNTAQGGYKLLIRVGPDGGQEVPHLHLHLIGGAKLSENIAPC